MIVVDQVREREEGREEEGLSSLSGFSWYPDSPSLPISQILPIFPSPISSFLMCISSLTSIFHHLSCPTPLLLIPIYQYTECLTCKTFGGKFLPGISFWSSHPTCFIISFFQGWRHSQCIINRLDERPLVETFPNEEKFWRKRKMWPTCDTPSPLPLNPFEKDLAFLLRVVSPFKQENAWGQDWSSKYWVIFQFQIVVKTS